VLNAINQMPVVKSGSASRLVVHRETDRMHDVQTTAKRGRSATNVPRVVWDFRVQKDDVQERRARHRFASALELILRKRTLETAALCLVGACLRNAEATPNGADGEPENVREKDKFHALDLRKGEQEGYPPVTTSAIGRSK
jgi:hypothetical protein